MEDDKVTYESFVEHPRYGRAPIITGIEPDYEEAYMFILPREDRIPRTGIKADISRQNMNAFPLPFYFDQRRTCSDCERPFIWFAEEQRYWFEELGFYIGTDCIRCVHCRQRLKGRQAEATTDSKVSKKKANKAEMATPRKPSDQI